MSAVTHLFGGRYAFPETELSLDELLESCQREGLINTYQKAGDFVTIEQDTLRLVYPRRQANQFLRRILQRATANEKSRRHEKAV